MLLFKVGETIPASNKSLRPHEVMEVWVFCQKAQVPGTAVTGVSHYVRSDQRNRWTALTHLLATRVAVGSLSVKG